VAAGPRCQTHRDRPSSFRCRSCRRLFCDECRALAGGDVCGRCELLGSLRESADEKVEIRATGIAQPRKKTAARWVVLALLVLNVAGFIFSLRNRASLSPAVREAFRDVEAVAQVVERNRDAGHRVPPALDKLDPPLPPPIAEKVQRGEIRYRPSEDRTTFTVEAVLDAFSGPRP
jgi:B-box zinc finger protein